MNPTIHSVEMVSLDAIQPHPQNYRRHPSDQREHLRQSIEQHGFYRNVVLARDGTILAGHGVVQAATEAGTALVPAVRLDLDPGDPQALKILAGDNEINRLAEVDDRQLTELLREVRELDVAGLLGTGFDDAMLSNLVHVTRGEGEVRDTNDAAQWVGLPEFERVEKPPKVVVSFDSEEDRDKFLELISVDRPTTRLRGVWSVWWPDRVRGDPASLRFDDDPEVRAVLGA